MIGMITSHYYLLGEVGIFLVGRVVEIIDRSNNVDFVVEYHSQSTAEGFTI